MRKDTYEDMIYMPHHVSSTHKQMEMSNRAAQFSPFAALKGYEQEIEKTQQRAEMEVEEENRNEIYYPES